MLYMLWKGNTTEWFVQGMTVLLASHRNGLTTPYVAKWQKNRTDGQLEWLSINNHMTIQL